MTEPTDAHPSEHDVLAENPLLVDALEFAHQRALVGLHHTAPYWRDCEFFPCNAYDAIEARQPAQPVTDDPLEAVLAAALQEAYEAKDGRGASGYESPILTAADILATPSGSRLRSAGAERDALLRGLLRWFLRATEDMLHDGTGYPPEYYRAYEVIHGVVDLSPGAAEARAALDAALSGRGGEG